MSKRPHYMPWWFNWRSVPPEFLILWFVVVVVSVVGWLIWAAIDASALTISSASVATLLVTSQAIIYGPRAWRAHKAGESGGWRSRSWDPLTGRGDAPRASVAARSLQ